MGEGATGSQTLRLFIAVRVPASPGLRRVLDALEPWRPAVKPVGADDLHLTLRFLGDTPAERVPELATALGRAVATAECGAFDVQWASLGRLPPGSGRKPVRVIHAEPADPAPFERLAAALETALGELDPPIPPEDRAFTAHLTLARVKADRRRRGRRGHGGGRGRKREAEAPPSPEAVDALCREHERADLGRCRIEAVQLIASELTPRGPIHTIKHEVRLGAATE